MSAYDAKHSDHHLTLYLYPPPINGNAHLSYIIMYIVYIKRAYIMQIENFCIIKNKLKIVLNIFIGYYDCLRIQNVYTSIF